jgi:hypothetical protein
MNGRNVRMMTMLDWAENNSVMSVSQRMIEVIVMDIFIYDGV